MSFFIRMIIVVLAVQVSAKRFTTDEVDDLFKILERFGERKLEDYKNQNKGIPSAQYVKQYITVTILSEPEITESKNWGTELPTRLAEDDNRVQVILNCKIEKGQFIIDPRKPLHGEIIFLYFRDIINTMLDAFRTEQEGYKPYVFVYSYYIPCANVKGVEYSCSEELANHQLVHINDYKMVVGWTEIFSGTDEINSRRFLSMAGIQQFQKFNNVFQKQEAIKLVPKPSNIFQSLYFSCLNSIEYVETCCVIKSFGGSEHKQIKSKILAYYINIMFAICTLNSNSIGRITRLSIRPLSDCIEDYINSNTGHDCSNCTTEETQKNLHLCSIYSQAYATHVGTPVDRNDPYKAEWKEGSNAWNSLYGGFNADVTTRQAIHCFDRKVTMKSICTQMGSDIKDLPDQLINKAKFVTNKKKNFKTTIKQRTITTPTKTTTTTSRTTTLTTTQPTTSTTTIQTTRIGSFRRFLERFRPYCCISCSS